MVARKQRWGLFAVLMTIVPAVNAASGTPAVAPVRAADYSPWVGLSAGGFMLGDRARVPLAFGPELGAYFFRRVRLAGRMLVPVAQSGDVCVGDRFIYVDAAGVYTCIPSSRAHLAYGGSVGVVLLDTEHWLLSPSFTFLNTNEADHGVMLGGSLPLDWITSGGLHLGLELGLGAAVSQTVYGSCRNHVVAPCVIGSVKRLPNIDTQSGFIAFTLGWSLTKPRR
jgi:hypothetical protein